MSRRGLCPNCDARFQLDEEVRLWSRVTCPECGADLEVIELDPLELDFYMDYGEEEEEYEYEGDEPYE